MEELVGHLKREYEDIRRIQDPKEKMAFLFNLGSRAGGVLHMALSEGKKRAAYELVDLIARVGHDIAELSKEDTRPLMSYLQGPLPRTFGTLIEFGEVEKAENVLDAVQELQNRLESKLDEVNKGVSRELLKRLMLTNGIEGLRRALILRSEDVDRGVLERVISLVKQVGPTNEDVAAELERIFSELAAMSRTKHGKRFRDLLEALMNHGDLHPHIRNKEGHAIIYLAELLKEKSALARQHEEIKELGRRAWEFLKKL